MKGWQVTKPLTIEEITRTDNLESVSSAKVKITKALLTDNEAVVFGSNDGYALPIIPGRSAVGVVDQTGSNGFGIEKGTRVYLSPTSACGECYNCKNSPKAACINLQTAGENCDGFFKTFAVVDCCDLFALPDSVSDEQALFLEYVAMSITIIDKLNISKGEHISIIGGGTLGNILSQLIIYYRGVPVLIEKDDTYLDLAQKSGIYYTIKHETLPQIVKQVSALTGGRMTEKSVYITDSNANVRLPFALTSLGGSVAFTGFNANNTKVDIAPIMKNKLNVTGITDGYGLTEAAINLLVNKAVDFSAFSFGQGAYKDIDQLIAKRYEKFAKGEKETEVILNMI